MLGSEYWLNFAFVFIGIPVLFGIISQLPKLLTILLNRYGSKTSKQNIDPEIIRQVAKYKIDQEDRVNKGALGHLANEHY